MSYRQHRRSTPVIHSSTVQQSLRRSHRCAACNTLHRLERRTLLATATHLIFALQPSNCTVDNGPGPFTIYAVDYNNVIDTSFNETPQVAFKPGFGSTAYGDSFSIINGVGSYPAGGSGPSTIGNYTATVINSTLPSATSQSFTVTQGAPARLQFTAGIPSAAPAAWIQANSTVSPPLQVTIFDRGGNIITGSAGPVSLSLFSAPTGATLSGNTALSTSNGIVSFSNITFSTPGSYVLQASLSNVTVSTELNVGVSNSKWLGWNGYGQAIPSITATAGSYFVPWAFLSTPNQSLLSPTLPVSLSVLNAPDPSIVGTTIATVSTSATSGAAEFNNITFTKSGNYTLQITDGYDIPNLLHVQVKPAFASHWVILSQPTTGTVGVPLTPSIIVEPADPYGNLVGGGTAYASISSGPIGATITAGASGSSGSSAVQLSNLTVSAPGLYTFSITAPFLPYYVGPNSPVVSAPILVGNVTSARRLVFLTQPSTTVAGQNIAPAVQVAIEDQNGNIVTSDTSNITISATLSSGANATLSGTLTARAVNGVATFSNLSTITTGTYRLNASDTAENILAYSGNFTIQPGKPGSVQITQSPAFGLAGNTFGTVFASVCDIYGNLDTLFNANLTISIDPSSGTLSGPTTLKAAFGQADFTNLYIQKSGQYTFHVVDTADNLDAYSATPITIAAGTAAKVVFLQQPSTAQAGVSISPAFQVGIFDAYGNMQDLPTNDTVTLSVATRPTNTNGQLAGTTTVQLLNGIATFSNISLQIAGDYTLKASDMASFLSSTSSTITVAPTTGAQLSVAQQPAAAIAGQTLPPIQILMKDAFGNTASTDASNLTISVLSGPGALAGNTTIQNAGNTTFSNVSLNIAGTYTLQISDPTDGISVTTAPITIAPGAPAKIALTVPAAAVANQTVSFIAEVEDQFNNTVTSTANATLSLASGPAPFLGPSSTFTFDGVTHFYNVSFNSIGTYTLTFTDATDNLSASADITISGPPAQLAFVTIPTSITVHQPLLPLAAVAIDDASGNLVQSQNASLRVTLSGPGHPSIQYAFRAVGGTALLSGLSFPSVGNYTITVDDILDNLSNSANITVTPGAPAQLVFLHQPANITAGASAPPVTLAIEDAYGNIVTSGNADFSFTMPLSTFPISDPLPAHAVNGIVTCPIPPSSTLAGNYAIHAFDDTDKLAAVSNPFTVSPAAPNQLLLSSIPSPIIAGQPIPLIATLEDAYGNLITADTSTLAVSIASDNGQLLGTTSTQFSNGTATFSNLSITTPGNYNLMASDPADNFLSNTTNSFTIGAGSASRMIFSTQPASVVAGEPFCVSVFASDALNNPTPQSITLSLLFGPSGATLSGPTFVQAMNGFATFNNLTVSKSGTFFLQAESGNLTVTSRQFTAAPPPTHLALAHPLPTTALAGKGLPFALQVLDANNHLVTADNSTITVTLSNHGKFLGATAASVVRGIATFSSLSIISPGAYALTFKDASLTPITTSNITITPDTTSAHLHLIKFPKLTLLGKPLTPALLVDVEDKFGNRITTDNSIITLKILTGPKGANILNATAKVTHGLAIFSNTVLTRGGNYTLSLADTALPIKTPITLSESIRPLSTTLDTPATIAASYVIGKPLTLATILKSAATLFPLPFAGTVTLSDVTGTLHSTAVNVSSSGHVTITFLPTAILEPGVYICTLTYSGDSSHLSVISPKFVLKLLNMATPPNQPNHS